MNNLSNDNITDNLLETIINAYLNPSPPPPQRSAGSATPQPPYQPMHQNNAYSLYYNLILTLRDTISGYNANTRLILDIIRALRQDIAANIQPTNNRQPPQPPPTPFNNQQRFFSRNNNSPTGSARQPVRLFNVDLLSTMYTNQPNLQDVIVRPTANQLNAALETITYAQSARSHSRCPITLEDFVEGDQVTRIRPCGHMFQTQSIRNWFSNRVRCPVCRCDIREYREPLHTDVSNNSPTAPTSTSASASASTSTSSEIEQSLNGLTENISNLIASYFANNVDLSNNQTFRFEIPIVTTYEVQEDSDDAEDDVNNAEDDNSDE
jgi:hypothetical protein